MKKSPHQTASWQRNGGEKTSIKASPTIKLFRHRFSTNPNRNRFSKICPSSVAVAWEFHLRRVQCTLLLGRNFVHLFRKDKKRKIFLFLEACYSFSSFFFTIAYGILISSQSREAERERRSVSSLYLARSPEEDQYSRSCSLSLSLSPFVMASSWRRGRKKRRERRDSLFWTGGR